MAQARLPDRTRVQRDDEHRFSLRRFLLALDAIDNANLAAPAGSEVFVSVIGKVGEEGARVTVKIVRPQSGA